MSDSLQTPGLQHTRPPCPSPTPRVYSNSCPLSWWCHPTVSSSVIPFSSHLQSFPASGSFQMSQFFASDSQSIGVSASASVFPMNIQDWSPLGWTGWISLQSKGLSKIYDLAIPCLSIYPKKMKSLKKDMCILMFITALFTANIWSHPKFLSKDEWRICVVCVCMCMHAQSLSHVQLFATPWTAACQAFLFMEFSKQED